MPCGSRRCKISNDDVTDKCTDGGDYEFIEAKMVASSDTTADVEAWKIGRKVQMEVPYMQ